MSDKAPIRIKDTEHLIPAWQKEPLYVAYQAAKANLEASNNEADKELLEEELRQAHFRLVESKLNTFAKVDFVHRTTNKGFFIS